MKIKTNELTGDFLNWAVAKCEGLLDQWSVCAPIGHRPSTDWAQGGPIIERETISVHHTDSAVNGEEWMACLSSGEGLQYGATPLIAAMRCYVASKLGTEIKITGELL